MDTDTRNRVVAEASAWVGTPWHHQGRVKGVGVDCAMLLCEVYHAAGLVPFIDPRPYPRDWHYHREEERFLGWLAKYGFPVLDPKPGDIAIFKFGRCFSHGAIIVDWPLVIHSYINDGTRYERADEGNLAGREVQFYRIRQ